MSPDPHPSAAEPQYHALNRRAQAMFQVTFSDQSMGELNKLGVEDQLRVVDEISNVTPDDLTKPSERIGRFSRDGRTYYRVRAGDFRCYFEIKDNTLYSHYIVHRHTVTDFVFRFKLPVSEEQMAEQHSSFWKYLETLKW